LLPAPKIFKETCEIDFTRKAEDIRNFVRGLSPYPAAWCNLQLGETTYENVKVYRVAVSEQGPRHGHIIVSCQDGYVELLELQLPGKKRMDSKSLLNGLRTD
ncbi:MAG: methionyl-tRNA formyltransferase, partial [Paludibacteraceae bacterium]|nr:methionyl-tRNA formyltransferase [Paludibacteraceae bacterium]